MKNIRKPQNKSIRVQQVFIFFVLFILIGTLSACIPEQATSPAAPPPLASQAGTLPTSQFSIPVPSTTPLPLPTLRPQVTCTRCMAITATGRPAATASPLPPLTRVVLQEKLDVWDDPANENSYWHRQTQLITGEPVLALDQSADGEWTQIVAINQPTKKDERGYPGWVRTSGLGQASPGEKSYAVVIAGASFLLSEPRQDAVRLMRLVLDTRLPIQSVAENWVAVTLPDGRTGWLKRGELRLALAGSQPMPTAQMLETARTLAGAPYLWGGTTPDSPDCSGFTYRLFHAYGIILPRDADDQSLAGQPVPFDQKKPGDLVFYSDVAGGPVTHVGLFVGSNLLMDANPWLGLSVHPLGDMQKWYVFHSVRRILP